MTTQAMIEIPLRELARLTGISYQKLLYDANHQRLPARRSGRRILVDIDNDVIQAILRDPAAYMQRRDFTNRKQHAIMLDNVTYPSVAALARSVGVSRETVYNWIREGKVLTVPKPRLAEEH